MGEPSAKIVAALEAAVEAVKAAKVPKDLREVAFNAVFYGQAATPAGPTEAPKPLSEPQTQPGEQADAVGKIAAKLELDVEMVSRVYEVDEDGVHLTIKPNSLSSTKKFAQQEVACLLVAGRQAIGLEEWTPTRTVIEATHDRGVHDTNVSKAVGSLDGDGFRFHGPKAKREMKISAVGYSKAAEIVKRLTESS